MVNEWTRKDLPSPKSVERSAEDNYVWITSYDAEFVLGVVVDHLNANHPKSGTDRWRRAHEIVEGERDQARESLREVCKVAQSYKVDAYQATERAEAAESELADEYSEANQKAAAWDRVAAHPALKMDLLPEADHTYAGGVFERITWLAEAAEDRTAPAVSRADVAEALSRCLNPEMWNVTFPSVVNEVCDLFCVEAGQAVDPVETKARELHEVAQGDGPFIVWEALNDPERARYRRMAAHILEQEAGDE